MHPIEQELFALTAQLSTRARVTLGAIAIEHVLPLYRIGPFKLTASEALPKVGLNVGDDLVDRGLALAWDYALGQALAPDAVAVLSAALEAALADAPRDKAVKAGLGAGLGLVNVLNVVLGQDDLDTALARVVLGISPLFAMLEGAETIPGQQKRLENVWHQKVAKRLIELGDKSIERKAFDDLLAEKLPWHDLLSKYERKVSAA